MWDIIMTKLYKIDPTLSLVVLVILFLGMGMIPGVPLPGLSMEVYATEVYVDERIAKVENSLAYRFAVEYKRDTEKEIFELEILKDIKPGEFTSTHSRRLKEKAAELEEIKQKLKYYRTVLKVNPN